MKTLQGSGGRLRIASPSIDLAFSAEIRFELTRMNPFVCRNDFEDALLGRAQFGFEPGMKQRPVDLGMKPYAYRKSSSSLREG